MKGQMKMYAGQTQESSWVQWVELQVPVLWTLGLPADPSQPEAIQGPYPKSPKLGCDDKGILMNATPLIQKIPRVLGVLCQELGTKTKYTSYHTTNVWIFIYSQIYATTTTVKF